MAVKLSKFVLVASLIAAPVEASDAVKVIDGDTIEIGSVTYRLNGVDAPEAGQTCAKSNGRRWRCGEAAIEQIHSIVSGSTVRCNAIFEDGYGRTIATCYADGNDIAAELITGGWAWAFVRYSDAYIEEQSAAQSLKIGIWQEETQTPWDFRAERWLVASQVSPDGCPIKGNISRNGRIYHPPWSPWYGRTRITVEKGERWFCSEAEAIAAGWRAPRWR